jgi:hypothetical protein
LGIRMGRDDGSDVIITDKANVERWATMKAFVAWLVARANRDALESGRRSSSPAQTRKVQDPAQVVFEMRDGERQMRSALTLSCELCGSSVLGMRMMKVGARPRGKPWCLALVADGWSSAPADVIAQVPT